MTGMIIDTKSIVDAFLGGNRLASIWLGDTKLWPNKYKMPYVTRPMGESQDATWIADNQRMTMTINRKDDINDNDKIIVLLNHQKASYSSVVSWVYNIPEFPEPLYEAKRNDLYRLMVYNAKEVGAVRGVNLATSNLTIQLPRGVVGWTSMYISDAGMPVRVGSTSGISSFNAPSEGLIIPTHVALDGGNYWQNYNIPGYIRIVENYKNFLVGWSTKKSTGNRVFSKQVQSAGVVPSQTWTEAPGTVWGTTTFFPGIP